MRLILMDAARLRIAFVLPFAAPRPRGALKVVYRIAEWLTFWRHTVVVLHPEHSLLSRTGPVSEDGVLAVSSSQNTAYDGSHPHPWHRSRVQLDSRVVPCLAEEHIGGPYDAIVATAWQVVPIVEGYSPACGRKLYYLQDYESYLLGTPAERGAIGRTLAVPWPLVVSSQAIAQFVRSVIDRQITIIPCAVDVEAFQVTVPIDSEHRCLIGFPARREQAKCTGDAIEALTVLRSGFGRRLQPWCFGYDEMPMLPNWIYHVHAPDDDQLRHLYNLTRIFIVPSMYEGFGLPGAEAMACGAALVSTRNGGVDSYAIDDETALLCDPREPPHLAATIERLLADDHLRRRIACRAAATVNRRTWEHAAREFEHVLFRAVQAQPREPR
ncbi:MAG: glycosyltransferase family 4 protein [Pseudonocardiaceae bacterium]